MPNDVYRTTDGRSHFFSGHSAVPTTPNLGQYAEAEQKNNPKARRGEAELLANSSSALRRLNRSVEAKQRIDRAFELLKETKNYPADRITPDSEAAGVLFAFGDHLATSGRTDQAREVFKELLDKTLASNPDPHNDLRHAVALSRVYERLIDVNLRAGLADDARDLSARRSDIWQNWKARLPQNAFIQRQLR